jgi:TolB protein
MRQRTTLDAKHNDAKERPNHTWRLVASVLLLTAFAWVAWYGIETEPSREEASLKPTLAALSTELALARSEPSDTPAPRNASATAEPAEAPSAGWVLFTAGAPLHRSIWATRPGSPGQAVKVTDDGEDAADPAVSPDGRLLAYRSHRDGQWDLYLRDLTTGQLRRLTETAAYEGNPTWSPDGHWIAYDALTGGDLDVWILSIDPGRTPIQLTNHPGIDRQPTWDPSGGRKIAFISDRDGSPDIFLADLDLPSERFVNLTQSPDWAESGPTFNLSGTRLAYATSADGLDLLWTRTLDPDDPPDQIGVGYAPTWLADGAALAAVQRSAQSQAAIVYNFGGEIQPLTISVVGTGLQMAWSNDPNEIAGDPATVPMGTGPTEVTERAQSAGSAHMSLIVLENVDAPNARLVEAASQPFRDLRADVEAAVGWDFLASLDEAFVGLNDPLPPGFAYNDWLYTGRAFAFEEAAYESGWVEVVPEPIGGLMYWRVYVKAAWQDGTLGEPLPERPWDFNARFRGDPSDYDQGGRERDATPNGYYVDFTALAAAHGFERQPALNNWRAFFPGTRFTEFAYTEGLNWRTAMMQLYPLEAIVTPTPFSSPTRTPTNTPWPTWTPWWWQWRTPTFTPTPSPLPSMTPGP